MLSCRLPCVWKNSMNILIKKCMYVYVCVWNLLLSSNWCIFALTCVAWSKIYVCIHLCHFKSASLSVKTHWKKNNCDVASVTVSLLLWEFCKLVSKPCVNQQSTSFSNMSLCWIYIYIFIHSYNPGKKSHTREESVCWNITTEILCNCTLSTAVPQCLYDWFTPHRKWTVMNSSSRPHWYTLHLYVKATPLI